MNGNTKQIELSLLPSQAFNDVYIEAQLKQLLRINPDEEINIIKLRRSIDARSRQPHYKILFDVYVNSQPLPEPVISESFKPVSNSKQVIIIGAGPAGYFAALELIENGIKPVIFDRGKDVRSRRRDLRAIQQFSIVNPDSNYCFGEGGAGTYSDGKLYTRSHKRGDIRKALRLFVEHGASSDIMIDTHPHIGSNKLPKIVQNLRATIEHYGGEVHFESKLTGLMIEQDQIKGVIINNKVEHIADNVILATGHSARDVFHLLHKNKIRLERKPFAIGVRAEHPQALIDEVQYRQNPRERDLPAASYKFVTQVNGRGVFSFCMCPGGLIVPAATSPGEIVVNGMSMSRRDSPFANSGIVVQIEDEDLTDFESHGVFAGLELQAELERKFFDAGDGSQKAPAQRLPDFVNRKVSQNIGKTSYIPGVYGYDLNQLLPEGIRTRLAKAVQDFGKKMRGYYSDEGYLVGIESRTSSPVRIPRDKISYEHVQVKGLYPSGEGAGYAGGIISAALDGQNVALAISKKLK